MGAEKGGGAGPRKAQKRRQNGLWAIVPRARLVQKSTTARLTKGRISLYK
jgi:hypothetical protein